MKYSAFSALSDMYTDQKAKKLRDFEKLFFSTKRTARRKAERLKKLFSVPPSNKAKRGNHASTATPFIAFLGKGLGKPLISRAGLAARRDASQKA